MKLALTLIMLLLTSIDRTRISRINSAKADARKEFNDGHYLNAVNRYRYLIDSLGVDEDEVRMNLAHAYYLAKDTTKARPIYQNLTQSSKSMIRSNALQQLGVLNNTQGK